MKARYKYPNKSIVKLNLLQKTGKKELEKKIYDEQYILEEVNCLCGTSRYEVLAERDRYGIKNRTIICTDCGLIRTSPRMSKESYKNSIVMSIGKFMWVIQISKNILYGIA